MQTTTDLKLTTAVTISEMMLFLNRIDEQTLPPTTGLQVEYTKK